MVARRSFSNVPPMKHATLMALPRAVRVTVSKGGFAGLSSLAGTPSKKDLAVAKENKVKEHDGPYLYLYITCTIRQEFVRL